MNKEAHESVSPTWDALRKLGEQCPHPLKVEGECLIVLDSDRRRFTDLGTPEMAQFVLASVNYVQGILAQPASPVLHNEKDLASYWKATHDRVVAKNWELSRQIGALQKVGEQCLRPQQTPTGEGEKPCPQPHRYDRGECCGGDCASRSDKRWERRLIAEAICDGYSNGNEQFSDASAAIQHGCLMAADAVMAMTRPVAEEPAALAHPQQGGERDGWKLVPPNPTDEMEEAACCAADNGKFSGQYLRNIYRALLDAAPTSASKSSGEEA